MTFLKNKKTKKTQKIPKVSPKLSPVVTAIPLIVVYFLVSLLTWTLRKRWIAGMKFHCAILLYKNKTKIKETL